MLEHLGYRSISAEGVRGGLGAMIDRDVETQTSALRQTPLYQAHLKHGARIVPFAGWAMPVQYTGVIAEHLAVRQGVGMFDVSHMGETRVTGPKALELLQIVTVNDVAKLRPGRAHYSMLANKQGGIVDDIYVYCLGDEEFMVVTNAANAEGDLMHIASFAAGLEVVVEETGDTRALIAVQGPKSETTLAPHCSVALSERRKNDHFEAELFGQNVRMARTGYTGEDGFEIFCAPQTANALWKQLFDQGIVPCGLGARDTLRLEAGFPLYGHELTEETNPLATPFRWVVKTNKKFYGKEAMLAKASSAHRQLVGLRALERGIPREGYRVLRDGRKVGQVTSGTMSPSLGVGIALAWIEEGIEQGETLEIEVRANKLPATVVEPVFYTR